MYSSARVRRGNNRPNFADRPAGTTRPGSGIPLRSMGRGALIGAPNRGRSAYIFERDGSTWKKEDAELENTEDARENGFGRSVATSGEVALVGAPLENGNNGAGPRYVFRGAGVEVAHPGQASRRITAGTTHSADPSVCRMEVSSPAPTTMVRSRKAPSTCSFTTPIWPLARQHLAEHHLQDAAVPEVLDLGRPVDPHGHLELDRRTVLLRRRDLRGLLRRDAAGEPRIANVSVPSRPSEAAESPSAYCSGRMPIPTRFDRWIRSNDSAIAARTPSSAGPLAAQSRLEPLPYSLPASTTSGTPSDAYRSEAS